MNNTELLKSSEMFSRLTRLNKTTTKVEQENSMGCGGNVGGGTKPRQPG